MKQTQVLGTLLIIIFLISCQDELSGLTTLNKARKGRIGIRLDDGLLKFFDKGNDASFIPVGYNYTQLQDYSYNGITLKGHSTFIQEYYNTKTSEAVLAKLQEARYNVVRIFLNPAAISDKKGDLNKDYISNVADFIKIADQYGLSVIITTDLMPISYYDKNVLTEADLTWLNTQYLLQDEINIEIAFWQTLIDDLQSNLVPLDAILSYELRNEFVYYTDRKPFNESSGIVVHPNGKSYDMSNDLDKNALMDASFIYWSATVRNAILEKDTEALVSVGFFAPEPLRKLSKVAISQSDLDFIDLHMYPETATLNEYADYFNLSIYQGKPIIMGEFGYLEKNNQTIEEITDRLLNWKNDAMLNYHINGWILWTWHTGIEPELSISDEKDVIFNAFSPEE